MKMKVMRIKQTRHCLQGWFESTGYLAKVKERKAHHRMLRERYLRGDFEIIDGEVWMRDLKL
jgi:hypothetical protein